MRRELHKDKVVKFPKTHKNFDICALQVTVKICEAKNGTYRPEEGTDESTITMENLTPHQKWTDPVCIISVRTELISTIPSTKGI